MSYESKIHCTLLDILHDMQDQRTVWAVLLPDGSSYTLPADVVSFAVSAQDWTFDISYDGGLTYTLLDREGVREYGDWTRVIANSDQITILSHWDVDVIREIL